MVMLLRLFPQQKKTKKHPQPQQHNTKLVEIHPTKMMMSAAAEVSLQALRESPNNRKSTASDEELMKQADEDPQVKKKQNIICNNRRLCLVISLSQVCFSIQPVTFMDSKAALTFTQRHA